MDLPIITTKLNIPGLSSHQIDRKELLNELDECLHHKLTLISAPAGFGKSSLASAWALSRTDTAWLSLDESDNDPISFFSHFFYSLKKIHSDLGVSAISALQDRENINPLSLVISLINEVSIIKESVLMILDDYHLIEEVEIHKSLQLLIERMPQQLHLIILTRSDPPFSLSKLRSSEQVREIRVDSLQFGLDEITSFLNDKWQLQLKESDIQLLKAQTEGWVTGLQLSALSLAKSDEKSDFINNLKGDDRYIADYLTEQVLANLSSDFKEFLLKICHLNRFCSSLTDSVTGQTGTEEFLKEMEKDNLFLIPLDNQRKWFRLHHLFTDLLRQQHHFEKDAVQEIHKKASLWFESQAYWSEAIEHIIQSGESQKIVSLIEDHSYDFLLKRGETKTLLKWLKMIPQELIDSSIRLNLTYAWVLFYEVNLPLIQSYLKNIEKLLQESDDQNFRAEYEAVLATIAVLKGDMIQSVSSYRLALEKISASNDLLKGMILFGLGYGYLSLGRLEESEEILLEAVEVNRIAGNISLALKSLCFLSLNRIQQCEGVRSRQSLKEAFALAEDSGLTKSPVMSMAFSISAELEREENFLVEAAEEATKAIEIARNHSDLFRLFTAYLVMASIKDNQQSPSGALTYVEMAEELIAGKNTHLSSVRVMALRNRLLLKMGLPMDHIPHKPDNSWLSQAGAIMIPGQVCEYEHLTYVRYLLNQENYSEAQEVLEELNSSLIDSEKKRSRKEVLLLNIILFLKKGNNREAKELLEPMVIYSEDSGDLSLILEFSSILEPLFEEIHSEGKFKKVAALFKTVGHLQSSPELAVPLSEREKEVLPLLNTEMTNQQIADKLYVSVNTLKSHIKSINNKLNTANRKDACRKARELGMF